MGCHSQLRPLLFSSWIGLTFQPVHPGASAKLSAALAVPNSSYDGSEAITAYAIEARNENALYVTFKVMTEFYLNI